MQEKNLIALILVLLLSKLTNNNVQYLSSIDHKCMSFLQFSSYLIVCH